MKKVSIDVRVDKELKDKFNCYCKERELSSSEVIRYYIEGVVDNKSQLICPVKRDNTKVNMLFMEICQLIQSSKYSTSREQKILILLDELNSLY